MTFGLMREPLGHPRMQGFIDRIDTNLAAAEASDGFIARSVFDEATGQDTWGVRATPTHFQGDEYENRGVATLSLWQDLESVFAFAYSSSHAEALSKRKQWFMEPRWPNYVAWWVRDDHTPSWPEACQRYDRLECEGASPDAFDFKRPFGPDGQPMRVDRDVVSRKVAKSIAKGRQAP
jgi:uncharacterized protein DUF3291